MGAAVQGLPVVCADEEFARFSPPGNMSCADYTADFVGMVGGYVRVAGDGMCEFCQYATGDEFVSSFSLYLFELWISGTDFFFPRRLRDSMSIGQTVGRTMGSFSPTASSISSSCLLVRISILVVGGRLLAR